MGTRTRWGVLIAVAVVAMAACGGANERPARTDGTIRRVPSQYRSIQAAIDATTAGDVVVVAPGIYRESVVIETEGLTLRGEDRDGVIIDGESKRTNGVAVYAAGVTVSRLTVRNYRVNGVLIAGEYGRDDAASGRYRVSEVTAIDNGLYGIYAFGVRRGVIESSFASGSPDSGIYIGQCDPCDAVVRNNTAEGNRVGYEGTNATGVRVESNQLRRNDIGMNIGSGDQERLAPQHGSEVLDNVVADNRSVGIVIGGGRDNEVRGNEVTGHPDGGIVIVDQDGFVPERNRVVANTLSNPGPDLVLAAIGSPFGPRGNCASGNRGVTRTVPDQLEALVPCDGAARLEVVPSWSPPPSGVS